MPKTIIFSLDYDGCADILFQYAGMEEDWPEYQKTLHDSKVLLEDFFKKKCTPDVRVELYVGSLRQSRSLDLSGQRRNNNGSCFKNFAKYAEEKKWIFQPFLLADVENQFNETYKAGTAIKDPMLECKPDNLKFNILKNQIKHISKMHPKDEVEFYFLDDDPDHKILSALKKEFVKGKFPENITINFTNFNWYSYTFNGLKSPFENQYEAMRGYELSTMTLVSNFFSSLFVGSKRAEVKGVELVDRPVLRHPREANLSP